MVNPLGPEPVRASGARGASEITEQPAPSDVGEESLRAPTSQYGSTSAARGGARLVAAFAARSVPDLATRLRRDLEREGVVIEELGIGAAGEHVVVTVLVPVAARALLQRLADRSHLLLSFLNSADASSLISDE